MINRLLEQGVMVGVEKAPERSGHGVGVQTLAQVLVLYGRNQVREGARVLRALAQQFQCAPQRLALRRGYFHVLELKQRFKIFLRPGAFAFVVHAD